MFPNAQFKGYKRAAGPFLDNEMRWLRMQKDVRRCAGKAKKIPCVLELSHPCHDGLWGSECPRFIIIFQNLNLWISKFNLATRESQNICHCIKVLKEKHALPLVKFPLFLEIMLDIEVWFKSKNTTGVQWSQKDWWIRGQTTTCL